MTDETKQEKLQRELAEAEQRLVVAKSSKLTRGDPGYPEAVRELSKAFAEKYILESLLEKK